MYSTLLGESKMLEEGNLIWEWEFESAPSPLHETLYVMCNMHTLARQRH